MYNGIGLTTPRGSGTNGYVVRNLSALRSHETAAERAAAYDALQPPKHREPDEEILEHERKRKVEVKCLELQLRLEDEGLEEDEIERKVDELRASLLEDLQRQTAINAKKLKASDTHGLAAAKKVEMARMAQALGTRADYADGDAFNQEKQAELKEQRIAQKIEAEERRLTDKKREEEQKARWAAEVKERDRLRRREEDRLRQERRQSRKDASPPTTRRSPSPGYRRRRRSSPSRSPPPPRRRDESPRSRREATSTKYRRSRSPPPPPRRLSGDSPPHRRRFESRSPPRRDPLPRRDDSRGRSSDRVPARERKRSVSSGSAMSMSSDGEANSR